MKYIGKDEQNTHLVNQVGKEKTSHAKLCTKSFPPNPKYSC